MTAIDPMIEAPRRVLRAKSAVWRRMVDSPLNIGLTVVCAAALLLFAGPLFQWAVVDAAVWPATPEACQARSGACWSFVIAKHSQILFGIYPLDERWRPALVCIGLIGLLVYSVRPAAWNRWLAIAWGLMLVAVQVLMGGGVLGLAAVPTALWGGLPVTLILTVVAIGAGFPLAILLALARRSDLPMLRLLSTMFIETLRGLPLLSILFIASIMLPLLLPAALVPDKLVRALVALLLFAAAYMAEVVRGGLQAVPAGQQEAALALGLNYWQVQRLIVLPQALRVAVPALTSTIIVMIKNTSLVLVVGLFDLISSGKSALADPNWRSPAIETYIFISAIYFILCFSFGRVAEAFERRSKVTR